MPRFTFEDEVDEVIPKTSSSVPKEIDILSNPSIPDASESSAGRIFDTVRPPQDWNEQLQKAAGPLPVSEEISPFPDEESRRKALDEAVLRGDVITNKFLPKVVPEKTDLSAIPSSHEQWLATPSEKSWLGSVPQDKVDVVTSAMARESMESAVPPKPFEFSSKVQAFTNDLQREWRFNPKNKTVIAVGAALLDTMMKHELDAYRSSKVPELYKAGLKHDIDKEKLLSNLGYTDALTKKWASEMSIIPTNIAHKQAQTRLAERKTDVLPSSREEAVNERTGIERMRAITQLLKDMGSKNPLADLDELLRKYDLEAGKTFSCGMGKKELKIKRYGLDRRTGKKIAEYEDGSIGYVE